MPFRVIEERFGRIFADVGRQKLLIFGVMRNSVDFIISLYNSHTNDKFKTDAHLYTGDMNFEQFIAKWIETNSDQVRPQFTRFLDRQGKIGADYIISYEKLVEGLNYVASVIDVPALVKLHIENVSGQRLRRSDLSEKQLAWISRQFKQDEEFGAQFCDRRLRDNFDPSEGTRSLAATGGITSPIPQNGAISAVTTTMIRPQSQSKLTATSNAQKGEATCIRFLQTSDQGKYRGLLDLTSRTVSEYCSRHKYDYEIFLGVYRGYFPWQATYNRIPLLRRIARSGYKGWVCYMDADAFIADLDFSLAEYLSDKSEIAFIATTDRPLEPERPYWLINAGVFLLNLAHPTGQHIIDEWATRFEAITDRQLSEAVEWTQISNDQDLLQGLLRDLPGAETCTITQRGKSALLNYADGLFIRQFLRRGKNLQKRIDLLRAETDQVLGLALRQPGREHLLAPQLIRSLYRLLLLREPDTDGLRDHVEWINSGVPIEKIVQGLLESSEFISNRPRFVQNYLPDVDNFSRSGVALASNLTSLANKYQSDKGTLQGKTPHKYTYLYDLILDRYRNSEINILELGLAAGGPEVGGPVDRNVEFSFSPDVARLFPTREGVRVRHL